MAKKRVQPIDPALRREIRWAIDQVHRLANQHGQLQTSPDAPPQAPDDVVVLVPGGGIPARAGTVCTAVACPGYRIIDSDPDDLEITLEPILDGNENPVTYRVFNLSNEPVEGGKYVVTSRLKSGHRYVVLESCNGEY